MDKCVWERLPAVMTLSQSVVTAALPSIVVASDIQDLLTKYESFEYFDTFSGGVLESIPTSVLTQVNQHLADAVASMGINVEEDFGLAILSGAIMTAVFVVYTAAISHRSPLLVWQDYLSRAKVV